MLEEKGRLSKFKKMNFFNNKFLLSAVDFLVLLQEFLIVASKLLQFFPMAMAAP